MVTSVGRAEITNGTPDFKEGIATLRDSSFISSTADKDVWEMH